MRKLQGMMAPPRHDGSPRVQLSPFLLFHLQYLMPNLTLSVYSLSGTQFKLNPFNFLNAYHRVIDSLNYIVLLSTCHH